MLASEQNPESVLVPITIALCVVLLATPARTWGEDDNDPHATGLRPATPEHQAWLKQHVIKALQVRPNSVCLDRVNAERSQAGLAPFAADAAGAAPVGQEVTGATEESLEATGTPAPAVSMASASALPSHVDNSTLKYFPPVRSQGGVGACVQWSEMYYCYTYMNAWARNLDVKNGGAGNNAYIFSPKFTYNFANMGQDMGSMAGDGFRIAQTNGCATWQDFPYDNNYRAWPLTANIYRNAINYRAGAMGEISAVNTDAGLTNLKQMLANGYVLSFCTEIFSWQYKTISNDPSTTADDANVGKQCCWCKLGFNGAHCMTVVGYDDNIWVDINGNGKVDPGEKGALRICNSWGPSWKDGGFTWLAYDALKDVSAVSGVPAQPNRTAVMDGYSVDYINARASYTPKVLAQFTLNSAARMQLICTLGVSDNTKSAPTTLWQTSGLSYLDYSNLSLGNDPTDFAFDGTTTACDATFVFDFSDLAPSLATNKRYYLPVVDQLAGKPCIVKSYSLIDAASGRTLSCAMTPATVDGSLTSVSHPGQGTPVNFYIDTGSSGGTAPSITSQPSNITVTAGATATFSVVAGGSAPLTYQWKKNGAAISGATAASYTTPATTASDSGAAFTVVISNSAGSITSNTATLTVTSAVVAPAITSQPANITVAAGSTAAFKVAASGTAPLTYQWKRNGTAISGATAATYTTPAATASDNGALFAVVVSNAAGSIISANAKLTVTSAANQPPVLASVTASLSAALTGQKITFSAAASDAENDALTYTWNFGDGDSASGPTAAHAYSTAGTYTATVAVSDGVNPAVSASLAITITPSFALSINSGGALAGRFKADTDFTGGSIYTSTHAINTSAVYNPGPGAVYQSERHGTFSYTIGGLVNGATYRVRLLFAELLYNAAGQRLFDVAINGQPVLKNFDIFATAKGEYIAIGETFNVVPTSGQILIQFTNIKNGAKSSGVEVTCIKPVPATGPAAATIAAADDTAEDDAANMSDGAEGAALASIDLGTVHLGQHFKLKLDAPGGQKAHWVTLNRKQLPPGVALSGGLLGGRPAHPGVFQFNLELKGSKGAATITNSYTLTVAP